MHSIHLSGVRGLNRRNDVVIKIYITRTGGEKKLKFPQAVKIRRGRPKIEEAVVKIVQERMTGSPMAVIASGSGSVVGSARKGAVKALADAPGRRGLGEAVYWEVGYGW
jgi:hypothetical protein